MWRTHPCAMSLSFRGSPSANKTFLSIYVFGGKSNYSIGCAPKPTPNGLAALSTRPNGEPISEENKQNQCIADIFEN
jgi:hypothetical protein